MLWRMNFYKSINLVDKANPVAQEELDHLRESLEVQITTLQLMLDEYYSQTQLDVKMSSSYR